MVPFSCALSVNYNPDQKFQRNSKKIHTYVRGLVFILLDIFNPRNLGFCVLKMTKPTPPPLPPRHFDNGGKSKGSGKKGLYSLRDALFARVLLKRETRFFYRALASFDVEAKVILKAGPLYSLP